MPAENRPDAIALPSEECPLDPSTGFGIDTYIARAEPGDTIHIVSGVFSETISLNKPVSLIGSGAYQTIIDVFIGQPRLGNLLGFQIPYYMGVWRKMFRLAQVIDLAAPGRKTLIYLTAVNSSTDAQGLVVRASNGDIQLTNSSLWVSDRYAD